MINKLKEKFDSWHIKSFALTIIILVITILLKYYYTDIRELFRQRAEANFMGHTNGYIVSIEPVNGMTQNRKGTQLFVDGYKLLYNYKLHGQSFEKTDIIPISAKNQNFIKRLLERSDNETFMIKFDVNDPSKSILVESE
jgi:hypothetical protein